MGLFCNQTATRSPNIVKQSANLGRLLPVLVLALSLQLEAADVNAQPLEKSVRSLMDHAGQVQVKPPEENPEAKQTAEALSRLFRSDAFQEKIRKERQRLAEEFFGAKRENAPGRLPKSPEEGALDSGERFYLFVSSSMPLETLRNYAADLARLNDPRFTMVLRGFIGGARRIAPTASFIADVLKANPDCDLGPTRECAMRDIPFIMDPLLFRRSGIAQVPAVVYIPGIEPDASGSGEDPSSARMTAEPLIVYGDTSLGYALELMSRETGNQRLGQLAAKLKPIP
jgi:type-F conjugative transfer system pilin assembly protein TrbC